MNTLYYIIRYDKYYERTKIIANMMYDPRSKIIAIVLLAGQVMNQNSVVIAALKIKKIALWVYFKHIYIY